MIEGMPTNGLDTTFDYLVFLFGPTTCQMKLDYERRGTITVNTEHSDNTIFATPHLNHCFRYWHDLCHIKANVPFTPEGERSASILQRQMVCDLVGPDRTTKARWCAIIDTEVNGQVQYYLKHGTFPTDQRQFAIEHLAAKGYDASTFPHTLDGLTIEY